MDKGIVETFGPYGLQKKVTEVSESINKLSTGIVTNYALYILIGLLFILNIAFFSNYMNINYLIVIVLITLISLPNKTLIRDNTLQMGIIELFDLFCQVQDLLPEFQAKFDEFYNQEHFTREDVERVIYERNRVLKITREYYQEAFNNLKDPEGRIENKITARRILEFDETKQLDTFRTKYSNLANTNRVGKIDGNIIKQLKTTCLTEDCDYKTCNDSIISNKKNIMRSDIISEKDRFKVQLF